MGVAPPQKTQSEMENEFYEMHMHGSARWGLYWLKINTKIRDIALEADVRIWEVYTKWLLTKIAFGLCVQEEAAHEADN